MKTDNNTADPENTPNTVRLQPDELLAASVWVFDLDNTLYPASSRLFDQVDWNMTDFVSSLLGLPKDEARLLQKQYFHEFGTTMRGLMTRHDVDPNVFLEYVHNIDLAPISADPALIEALEKLPGRKVIFTNGSTAHAENITRHIGIAHHFEGCFDIIDAGYVPKPAPDTYDAFCRRFDIDPTEAVMVEDMAKNLVPAAGLGMTTVWLDTGVGWSRETSDDGHVHHRIDDLADWLTGITQ
ncbi:pyrimidine 5'-nucleotidase [Thalassospiraceae bacterium LMO-JJ14]|nr:pyrimidine 5'-nucleotidase [Thalassospiraceae bacterium LMO-JJ14]